jgi:hypothetical protein
VTDDQKQRKASLVAAIKGISNSISDDDAQNHAEALDRCYSLASSLQSVERMDREPQKDIDDIKRAARSMAAAANQLERVGWHGSKTFSQVLKCFFPNTDAEFVAPTANSLAQKELVESLIVMSDILNSAASSINPDALSVNSAFGDGPEFETVYKGKPTESAAMLFAADCAKVFHAISGSMPVVNTNPHERGNPAYGPFLDFVTLAFDAVGANASPQVWAKKAGKEFSPPSE